MFAAGDEPTVAPSHSLRLSKRKGKDLAHKSKARKTIIVSVLAVAAICQGTSPLQMEISLKGLADVPIPDNLTSFQDFGLEGLHFPSQTDARLSV